MAEIMKQEKTKYKLANSIKECMKTAPVDKIDHQLISAM